MKPPLSASKQSAPLSSCHCTPHRTHYSQRTNSPTHTPNTHIHSKRRHTQNSIHKPSSSSLTFTHMHNFICSLAGRMAWQPTRGRNIHSPYHPKPTTHSPTKISPSPNLIPGTERGIRPHNSASSCGSSLPRQGATSSPPATSQQHC